MPAATATDPDDVAGVRPRRAAVDHVAGRRSGDAADAGDGGLQRHDRRDDLRHLPDAGLLLRDRLPERQAPVRLAARAAYRDNRARRADAAIRVAAGPPGVAEDGRGRPS